MLTLSRGDGSFGKLLTELAKTQLIIIGDWGLDVISQLQRNDLLEIIEDRRGHRATLITSQRPTPYWHDAIGDPTLADAIADRLSHNATKIQLTRESVHD